MNIFFHFKKRTPKCLLVVGVASIFFLNGCSNSYGRGEALLPGDEMKAGPGIFSGSKGAFYLVGGESKESSVKPVSKMNLTEASHAIGEKLEKLKRDQAELEILKREVDKKLRN